MCFVHRKCDSFMKQLYKHRKKRKGKTFHVRFFASKAYNTSFLKTSHLTSFFNKPRQTLLLSNTVLLLPHIIFSFSQNYLIYVLTWPLSKGLTYSNPKNIACKKLIDEVHFTFHRRRIGSRASEAPILCHTSTWPWGAKDQQRFTWWLTRTSR